MGAKNKKKNKKSYFKIDYIFGGLKMNISDIKPYKEIAAELYNTYIDY